MTISVVMTIFLHYWVIFPAFPVIFQSHVSFVYSKQTDPLFLTDNF